MAPLRAGSPLRVGAVTLVPVERVSIRSDQGDAGHWVSASKEVFAVVVCDADGVRVLAANSSEIALDALIDETPKLGAILSEIAVS